MDIGQKLIELRKKAHLSQVEIAAQLGISQNAYSKYERNESEPSLSTLNKLSIIFECSFDDLISTTNKNGWYEVINLITKHKIGITYIMRGKIHQTGNIVIELNDEEIQGNDYVIKQNDYLVLDNNENYYAGDLVCILLKESRLFVRKVIEVGEDNVTITARQHNDGVKILKKDIQIIRRVIYWQPAGRSL